MAHDSKQGFLSSLFGKKKRHENDEAMQLEFKHRIEERIRQVLADTVDASEFHAVEKNLTVPVTPQVEAEPIVDLLPISASVISSRKAPVQDGFLVSNFQVPRSYAANER